MNTAREIRNIWDEIGRMKGRTAGSASGSVKTFLGLNDTPAAYAGAALQNVRVNAGANALEFAAGGGDVIGPAGATDEALARFDTATGKLLQNSNALLSNAGELSLQAALFIAEIATPVARANYGAVYPKNDNLLYFQDGAGIEHAVAFGGGAGDVVGPGASTDNALARFHLATGKIIQNSNAILNDAGLLFLAETSNAFMTIGLTINQGANDNEIFAAKSSDVAHGCTTWTETDTYFLIKKNVAADGGASLQGFSDAEQGLMLRGLFKNNTTAFGGGSAVQIAAYKISGTGITNSDPNQVLLSIRTSIGGVGTTAWGVNASGQTWQSGTGWINETTNVKMTTGLTINQGAAEDEILALKSSDVAHGCTTYAETDTYGYFAKFVATEGGINISGFSEGKNALGLFSYYTTDDTTKSTAGTAPLVIYPRKIVGTVFGDMGANANVLALRPRTGGAFSTVWIADVEGDTWQTGGVDADSLRVRTTKTPASAAAAGTTGDICWDTSYIYVCIAANTWLRGSIVTWV